MRKANPKKARDQKKIKEKRKERLKKPKRPKRPRMKMVQINSKISIFSAY